MERNYRKKCGELDIVASKDRTLFFVEVKTESGRLKDWPKKTGEPLLRPEEKVNKEKIKRIARAVQIYLLEKRVPAAVPWEFMVVSIIIDSANKLAKVKIIKDVLPAG